MPIEWLGWARLAQSTLVGTKSIYDRLAGKPLHMNFEPGDDGVKLRINNPRTETVIVERIDVVPPILGFLGGRELEDVVRAVVNQRMAPDEHPLAVVPPGANALVGVMTFDPFGKSSPALTIKAKLNWRSATRGPFSRSSVTKKITVRDIQDLQHAVDRNQPRIWTT